jgi:hypothetical protein
LQASVQQNAPGGVGLEAWNASELVLQEMLKLVQQKRQASQVMKGMLRTTICTTTLLHTHAPCLPPMQPCRPPLRSLTRRYESHYMHNEHSCMLL